MNVVSTRFVTTTAPFFITRSRSGSAATASAGVPLPDRDSVLGGVPCAAASRALIARAGAVEQ